MRALRRAARTASKAVDKVKRKKKDSPELAERDRKAAVARTKERQRQENISTTQRTSSINKSRAVSKADIMAADTAADFRAMQRRIDDLPSGNRKKMMQDILDRQQDRFAKDQASEVDAASRKSTQAARDRKMKDKVTLPPLPFNKGGYANCGASMKATQKSSKGIK